MNSRFNSGLRLFLIFQPWFTNNSTSSFQASWLQMNQTWNCQDMFGILAHLDKFLLSISYAHGETGAVTPQTLRFPSHVGGRHRFLSIATICQSEACHRMSYNHPPKSSFAYFNPGSPAAGLFTIFAGKDPFEGPFVQSTNFPPNLWILRQQKITTLRDEKI